MENNNVILGFLKDFSPSLIGIVALIISYKSISLQVRKNSKAQWINEFRKEVSTYMNLLIEFQDKLSLEVLSNINKMTITIELYLDNNETEHKILSLTLDEMGKMLALGKSTRTFDREKFHLLFVKIGKLSKIVIAKEKEKHDI